MIYVEFRIRRPGIDLATFHQLVARRREAWSDRFSEDRLLLNIGRTWRIGPHPEYLAIYYTPGASLERLGEWERIFRSGAVADLEAQTMAVSPIEDAGCYAELDDPHVGQNGPYYAEYFDFTAGSRTDDVQSLYKERRKRYPKLTLHLLCDRIGKLGPGPRGLAVWGGSSYSDFVDIASEATGDGQSGLPIDIVTSGLYANVGEEIL